MKKALVTTLGVLSILASAIYIMESIPKEIWLSNESRSDQYVKVTTSEITAGRHNSMIQGYGEVLSEETLTLTSQVSGMVLWKNKEFKIGERIAKGDLLFIIDDSSYKVLLANAKKDKANAQLAFLQEQRKHQRAKDEWKVSGMKEEPSPLVLRDPQFKAAQAQLKAAQQSVEDAKRQLDNTKVYAPFNAIVSQSSIIQSSIVSSGTSFGQIKSVGVAEVHLALSEEDWQQIPSELSELSVIIQSDSHPQQQWIARASSLSMLVEQSTRMRNLILKIDAPLDQPQPLLIGRFVKVLIQGKTYSDSFVVPSSSITADNHIWYVESGILHRYQTQTLFQDIDAIGFARNSLDKQIDLVVKPLSSYVEGMHVSNLSNDRKHIDTTKFSSTKTTRLINKGDRVLQEGAHAQ